MRFIQTNKCIPVVYCLSSSKGDVLVSVPGTSEADEAVIMASIPQTASVSRATTTIKVSYAGEPEFKVIPEAKEVQYAINTSDDVFLVENRYYCCSKGIWFEAAAAVGPWMVCDKVPAAIYTIPPQSPKHNVTYVYVYDSTPETVVVGVTSGYSGTYIARGVVVFGLGYWLANELDHHHHYYPPACWYGYGCGAHYIYGGGYCGRGAAYYGPYGGAGFAASYNPATGTFQRAAYAYGPRGAAGIRTAYNPWTNTAAGRVGVSTPYGSWGRSAVVRGDEWIRAGHRSNSQGTIAGIQGSGGGAAVGVDRKYGSDAFVAKSGDGDVYAGKDGNIYRKNEDGEWQKRENGKWQGAPDVPRPHTPTNTSTKIAERPDSPANGNSPSTKESPGATPAPATRPTAKPTERPSSNPAPKSTNKPTTRPSGGYQSKQPAPSQLNRDSSSRERATRASTGGTRERNGRR